LRPRRSVLHPFEFFSPCEDFVILVEQAFQRALVSLVCFLRASAPSMRRPARVKEEIPVLAGFSCRLVADQREAHTALVFVVFPS
jgi:hypothetical protein